MDDNLQVMKIQSDLVSYMVLLVTATVMGKPEQMHHGIRSEVHHLFRDRP